jgi:hypothetical protein
MWPFGGLAPQATFAPPFIIRLVGLVGDKA